MRLEDRIKLRWVRGNDVTLRVMLTEPECDSNGVPVKNGSKQSWKAVDLDTYEQINAKLKRMFTGFTAMDTMCGQVEEPCCYPVECGKGDADGVLIVEAPGTLPVGIYALEVTGMCDGRSMRSFETMLFGIVECNGKANATFDVIEGQKSADVDIKVQLVSSATVRGKNAYELWKEIPGNENKTLQEYLDGIVSGEAEQADWNATNPQSRAYIKNKPDVYTKAEVQGLVNVKANSADVYDKAYIDESLSNIQSALTFDSTPTDGSSNPVTSNGVYDALQTKQNVISDLSTIRDKANNAMPSTTFKTVNNESVVGSGNIEIVPGMCINEGDARYAKISDMSSYTTDAEVSSSIASALEGVVYFGDTIGYASSEGGEGGDTPVVGTVTLDDISDGSVKKWSSIATTSQLNDVDASSVHKAGSETITGNKTFENNVVTLSTVENNTTTAYTTMSASTIEHTGGNGFTWLKTRSSSSDTYRTLSSVLNEKAVDAGVVHNYQNETINGIKTFNGEAIFKGGVNLTVDGSGNYISVYQDEYNATVLSSENNQGFDWIITDGQTLQGVLDSKVSSANIKTVNNQSLIGSGNLSLPALPAVTSSDNGKVATVVNGVWAASSTSGGSDPSAVHKTGNETIDGTKTLIGTLSVNDGMGGEIKSFDLNDFSWIKTANDTTLQSVITALANRVTALETALNNLYSYNSSTGVLTINNPNSNS